CPGAVSTGCGDPCRVRHHLSCREYSRACLLQSGCGAATWVAACGTVYKVGPGSPGSKDPPLPGARCSCGRPLAPVVPLALVGAASAAGFSRHAITGTSGHSGLSSRAQRGICFAGKSRSLAALGLTTFQG